MEIISNRVIAKSDDNTIIKERVFIQIRDNAGKLLKET